MRENQSKSIRQLKGQTIYQTMDSSGATPISLTADSCSANENRCHMGTPAPPTPYPYSPLSPYGAINPFSFMSRYSSAGAAHLQSAFSSPLASSLTPGLAYPTDFYHYNPYSALTPTSPLTPSSFWSLTAQQSMTTNMTFCLKYCFLFSHTLIKCYNYMN